MKEPRTLQEAIQYFSDPDRCLDYLAYRRWPGGVPVCPVCFRTDAKFLAKQGKWQCKSVHQRRQFSVKVNTVFEDSPIPLDKWLCASWMIVNCKNGVSSYEIHRAIGVTQKSAWFMLHRIRLAMQSRELALSKAGGPEGEVEADETFIGGRVKNMHKGRRLAINKIRSEMARPEGQYPGKTVVMGVLDRETRKVRATVVPNIKRETLQSMILKQVKYGTKLYTDDALGYTGLGHKYTHDVVTHVDEYVKGRVHTNEIENFWSLLKRGLHGTYVAVEPFHLFRYVDEQVFRFNNRKNMDNGDRFSMALSQIVGRRLTYAEVTGKVGEASF